MGTILIAEDDATMRIVLQRTLEKAGHCVHVARDGLEALAILDTMQIDLIMTDIRMPALSGADLVRLVRSALSSPQVILMSVDLRAKQYADVLQLADLRIAKPVDLVQLPRQVAELLAAPQLQERHC
jgi:CheY-like chemotaxis protein